METLENWEICVSIMKEQRRLERLQNSSAKEVKIVKVS